MKVKDKARFYKKNGLSVIPIRPGKKTPKIKWTPFQKRIMSLEEIEECFGKNSNIAIVTGKISNIIVLDIDPRNGGDETLKGLKIPDTVTAETGGGGLHFYFKYPEGFDKISPFSNTKEYPGVDLKADGGYIVGEPSLHPSGERYKFVEGKCFGEIELAEAPKWLLNLIKKMQSGNGKKNKNNSPKKANSNYNSMKTDNIFDAVNGMVGILDVWDRYGDGQETINNKICCPFHDDSNPSLSFKVEENYYNCFGCKAGGGPVDLVMRLLKLSSAIEAVNILEEDFNLDLSDYRKQDKANSVQTNNLTREIYKLIVEQGINSMQEEHYDYLDDEYGIGKEVAKKYKLGYIGNKLKEPLNKYTQNDLLNAGLLRKPKDTNELEFVFSNHIILPYFVKGEPDYLIGLDLSKRHEKSRQYLISNDSKVFAPEVIK